jgi:hypothetical protein
MVNGQHVRTFLDRLLETPFPEFPSPGQHQQQAAAAAAATVGGQGGGAPHQHAHHQQQQQEEEQEAPKHTLFLGMFGGYVFYHYLVNMRLLPLTKALALTQQLRRQVRRAQRVQLAVQHRSCGAAPATSCWHETQTFSTSTSTSRSSSSSSVYCYVVPTHHGALPPRHCVLLSSTLRAETRLLSFPCLASPLTPPPCL